MPSLINAEQPVWVATADPAFPWRVETSRYTADMAGWLDAGVTGSPLRRVTVAGRTLSFAPESIGYLDALGKFDVISALAHVAAAVSGDTITFETPTYRLRYVALIDRLKLTILFKTQIRAPDATLVDPATTILTLTGGITIPAGLEVRDASLTLRTGTWSTAGEIRLWDPVALQQVQYFDRVTVRDALGHPGHGELRLTTDYDGTRRLYEGVPWSWLQVASWAPTAAFPEGGVEIDPTVVATTTAAYQPRRPDLIYAPASARDTGLIVLTGVVNASNQLDIYKSTDGGTTFTKVSTLPVASYYSLVLFNGRHHLTSQESGGTQYRYSTDNGSTWSAATLLSATTYYSMIVPVPEKGASYLWFVGTDQNRTAYATSTDNGTTWTAVTTRILGASTLTMFNVSALYADGQFWVQFDNRQTGGTLYGLKIARSTDPTMAAATMDSDQTGFSAQSYPYPLVRDSNGNVWSVSYISTVRTVQKHTAGVAGWTNQTTTGVAAWNTSGGVAWQKLAGKLDFAYTAANPSGAVKRQTLDLATLAYSAESTLDPDTTAVSNTLATSASNNANVYDLTYKSGTSNVTHTAVTYNTAPLTPDGLSPSGGGRDAATAITLSATAHDDPADYPTDAQWQITDGTTTSYITAAGALTAGATWVPTGGGTFSISRAINAAQLTNSKTYQWRVMTRDTGGLSSPWSAYATFTTTAAPVTAIVTPAAGSTIGGPQLTMSVSVGGSFGTATYRLYADSAGAKGALLVEHAGVAATSKTMVYTLVTGTWYWVEAWAVSPDGVMGAAVSQRNQTNFLPPPTPALTATPNRTTATTALQATVAAPGGSESAATQIRFEATPDGGASVRTVATVAVAGGSASATDYAAPARTYQYRAVARSANGSENAGAWITATLTFDFWRFIPLDGSNPVTFAYQDNVHWKPEQDVEVPPTMDVYHREVVGPTFAKVADISARFGDRDGLTPRQWRERLLAHAQGGTAGYLKSPVGDVYLGITHTNSWTTVLPSTWEDLQCSFRQTGEVK